jgi:integrase
MAASSTASSDAGRRRRLLSREHFAFARAIAQGIAPDRAWDQYLRHEGEASDKRRVRGTVAWIRAEFAAAAKREARPGIERLVLLDPAELGDAGAAAPSLEAYAAARGMEDFSEDEVVAAWAEEFGSAARAGRRRARIMTKQLEALQWLEKLAAHDPKPGDGVGAWLAPSLASRLEAAGMPTLFALAERINSVGARWWTVARGVGAGKAGRILEWLQRHEGTLGLRVGAHVATPFMQLSAGELALVVAPATALRPLEKLVVPVDLDGSAGRYRAPREQCQLEATNDLAAIDAWLASRRSTTADKTLTATGRAYRKEAERLTLWAVLEAKKPISSLTVEDAIAFADFLRNPPASWCGRWPAKRWSPLWRPMAGPLGPVALKQAIVILRSLYAFLIEQRYVTGNPFAAIAIERQPGRKLGSGRTLSLVQWNAVVDQLQHDTSAEASPAARRRARAVRWCYATGLRESELTAARCGDLQRVDLVGTAGAGVGWLLEVTGKGGKVRQVPVPPGLVDELSDALARAGRPDDPFDLVNAKIPILASFELGELSAWSTSGAYKGMKTLFAQAAKRLKGTDAQRLEAASPHWLRHTHGSHALNGTGGRKPVPLQVVSNNLGHTSLATTSVYVQTELADRVKAMEGFWS